MWYTRQRRRLLQYSRCATAAAAGFVAVALVRVLLLYQRRMLYYNRRCRCWNHKTTSFQGITSSSLSFLLLLGVDRGLFGLL